MFEIPEYPWLKAKGYLHVTPKIDVNRQASTIIGKVQDPVYIAKYAFFPLIHAVIRERRYKAKGKNGKKCHSFPKGIKTEKTIKKRPLHYATHMDALIFGYYSYILSLKYEQELKRYSELNKSVIGYRKIPLSGTDKNKGTPHFAKEVFDEIHNRAKEECAVLKFDIEKFFSTMSHDLLKGKWIQLLGEDEKLPLDHYNVFKAATQFSYILKDSFRITSNQKSGKRNGFNEKRLAQIRNQFGKYSFFESNKEFRDSIKTGKIKIYKNSFRSCNKMCGIPQGLPISSVLANLYLLDFDKSIVNEIVVKKGGFYRRYSDDIVIICNLSDVIENRDFVRREIKITKVEMSEDKTEHFKYSVESGLDSEPKVVSEKYTSAGLKLGIPLTYLGFEYYGYKVAIKSANLAKFYRRMISAVKRKTKRAMTIALANRETRPILFRSQLHRTYTLQDLRKTTVKTRYNWLESNQKGGFTLKSKQKDRKNKSNYLKYVARAAEIMDDDSIKKQLKRQSIILRQAVKKHLTKQMARY